MENLETNEKASTTQELKISDFKHGHKEPDISKWESARVSISFGCLEEAEALKNIGNTLTCNVEGGKDYINGLATGLVIVTSQQQLIEKVGLRPKGAFSWVVSVKDINGNKKWYKEGGTKKDQESVIVNDWSR